MLQPPPTAPRSKRPLASLCLALAIGAAAAAQGDDHGLRARAMAALDGETPPPGRIGILLPHRAADHLGMQPMPGQPLAPIACPRCGAMLRPLSLWRTRPGIEGSIEFTALVCATDALFYVVSTGVYGGSECGPFALPAPGVRPTRPFLPHGALPLPDGAPLPPGPFHAADRSLWTTDADDGRLSVRDAGGPRWREPKELGDPRMGITACALTAQQIAFARSQGALAIASFRTGKVVARVPVRGGNVTALALPDRGDLAACCVDYGTRAELRLLDTRTGAASQLDTPVAEQPGTLQFSPSGDLLLAALWNGTLTARATAGGRLGQPPRWLVPIEPGWARPPEIAFSPDGRHLLVLTGGLIATLLAADTGAVVQRVEIAPLRPRAEPGGPAAWRADGAQYAWVLPDGRIATESVPARGPHVHTGAAELGGSTALLAFAADGSGLDTTDALGHCLHWSFAGFRSRR